MESVVLNYERGYVVLNLTRSAQKGSPISHGKKCVLKCQTARLHSPFTCVIVEWNHLLVVAELYTQCENVLILKC